MEDLLIQQQEAMRSVERALDNFKKVGKQKYTYGLVRNRIATLKENFARCQQLHTQLLTVTSPETKQKVSYFKDDRFLICEDTYNAASDYMTEFLVQLEPQHSPSPANVTFSPPELCNKPSFQLPRINLPSFSGDFNDWESFRDRFKAMVIDNQDLSNVARLHYLSSCLKHEAADLLRNLAITDANFTVAWQLMLNRYENKRRIINVHLYTLTNLPHVSSESSVAIRELRDKANITIQALKNLGRPVDQWDDLLVYLISQNLDKSSRKAWELLLGNRVDYPTHQELDGFLQSRICALEAMDTAPTSSSSKAKASATKQGHNRHIAAHTSFASTIKCPMCQANHFLSQCQAFKDLSVSERGNFVKQCQRCLNCFSSKHKVQDCTNKYSCQKCKQRHHTLLHLDRGNPRQFADSHTDSNPEQLSSHCVSNPHSPMKAVLLATAWVNVDSTTGRSCHARALLDQGSVTTLISENLAQHLRSRRRRHPVSISGVGDSHSIAKQITTVNITPCKEREPVFSTTAVIVANLTRYIPCRVENNQLWMHTQNLNLADNDPLSAHPIDLIIGADLYGSILCPGIRRGGRDEPVAQNTVFGWILSGPITSTLSNPSNTIQSFQCSLSDSLDRALRGFWEVEELPRRTHRTPLEQRCENHFVSTHSRSPDGRYVVRLPFKEGPPINIGHSRATAETCLYRLEKRFNINPQLKAEYTDFLRDYERLGHMKKVPRDSDAPSQNYYIPHYAVIRESSVTSRLRVVFDASRKSSNGISLNEHLLTGPKLQTDLPSIILRWRQHRFVYTADIEKMYRQILVDERDVHYQRILWRTSLHDLVRDYQLQTVTYGTACAPFLALRVLQQFATDEGPCFPLALPILRQQTYVDDCVFGADSQALATETRDQLVSLLRTAGFKLRKWASNCSTLLRDISPDDHGHAIEKSLQDDKGIKILGIAWNPERDTFHFTVFESMSECRTKRNILSVIARIFDPLGWVAPVIITAKILLQQLWLQKVDWDEVLPDDLLGHWDSYYGQFPLLKNLEIRRWTAYAKTSKRCELQGFADASTVAYAAVIYLRVTSDAGEIVTSLLAAKSKVAPIKPLSVPRLELSAAFLLARLMEFVRSSLGFAQIPCYCWTDSTITLAWLRQHPARWKMFIANRVAGIHTLLPNTSWRHVPSHQNPADCASRGLSASEILSFNLWWTGPAWLRLSETEWPAHSPSLPPDVSLEERPITVLACDAQIPWDLEKKFSSWPKLLRVTAYVLRFVRLLRARHCREKTAGNDVNGRQTHPLALTSLEIQYAKTFWLRKIQHDLFLDEERNLAASRPLKKGSAILALNPFLDSDGLLQVGGRLKNALLSEKAKHPIILASHPLGSLIIMHAHLRGLYAGPQLTLRLLREKYWFLRARQVVRSCLHRCVACTRERAAVPSELMGDLPRFRVTRSARAFLHCGVDYAGPFLVRTAPGRGHKTRKAYLALFVCLCTRCIHLKLVSDYTTAAFLAAFDRFCAQRGLPSDVYSDNGTTFQRADRELSACFRSTLNDPNVQNKLVTEQISWHFLPPLAPHFGGLWEAGVKSVKHHVKRVIGAHTLTFEELATLFCQIEACLNPRPIAPMSDDIESYSALTPGHFLIGSALTTVPSPSLLDIKESRLSRWQLLRQMTEGFWKPWANEYIHTLQQRPKWRSIQNLARVGKIVILRNPLAPPSKWELGRIIECHPGEDGLVRVVTVQTARSRFKRPISKLCFLPIDLENVPDQEVQGGR